MTPAAVFTSFTHNSSPIEQTSKFVLPESVEDTINLWSPPVSCSNEGRRKPEQEWLILPDKGKKYIGNETVVNHH